MLIVMPQQPRRSKTEITEELLALHTLLGKVPAQTAFGDDNQAAIRAQIRVIEEQMSLEAVVTEFDGQGDYILSNAIDALQWFNDDDEPVSVSWAGMIAAPISDADTMRAQGSGMSLV